MNLALPAGFSPFIYLLLNCKSVPLSILCPLQILQNMLALNSISFELRVQDWQGQKKDNKGQIETPKESLLFSSLCVPSHRKTGAKRGEEISKPPRLAICPVSSEWYATSCVSGLPAATTVTSSEAGTNQNDRSKLPGKLPQKSARLLIMFKKVKIEILYLARSPPQQ